MISPSKTPLAALCCLLALGSITIAVRPTAAAPLGSLLQSFTLPRLANGAVYFPIGVAFDGHNLWYSHPANNPNDVFLTTPTGTLLSALGIEGYAGGLAWDGSNLWVASFRLTGNPNAPPADVELYQIGVGPKPTVLKELDITSIILGNGSCTAISGLDFDIETHTLWLAPNPCVGVDNRVTVYNIDTSGNLLKKLSFGFPIAGVAKVGNSLYLTQRDISPNVIVQSDLDGNVISSFKLPWSNTEDLAFDRATFNHTCALWVMHFFFDSNGFNGSLNAFKLECPE